MCLPCLIICHRNIFKNLMFLTSSTACGAWGVEVDLVLRRRRPGIMTPLGKPACHNLGLGRRTYASGNSEEMEIQSRETRESI